MNRAVYSRPALIQWGFWGVLTGLLVSVLDSWITHHADSARRIAAQTAIFVIVGVSIGPAIQHGAARISRGMDAKSRIVLFVVLTLALVCLLWIMTRA
jgi:hypothetical protein